MKLTTLTFLITTTIFFTACENKINDKKISKQEDKQQIERWYSQAMVQKGKVIYENNCISCHGEEGKGVILPWNKPLENGSYPPPPLNDDAHAWHHSIKALKFTITQGGKPYGGVMPPFKDKLNDEEINNVIAYIQSLWTDPYYKEWLKKDGLTK